MSTTQMFSGYDEQRPTSKVICPPGGRSNNIFGTEPASYTAPSRGMVGESGTTGNRLFGEDDSPAAAPVLEADAKMGAAPAGVNTHAGNRRNHGDEEETEEERKKREEEEKLKEASPSRAKPPRGAYNPITGEDYPDKPSQEPAARARQPPGGRSSGPLW